MNLQSKKKTFFSRSVFLLFNYTIFHKISLNSTLILLSILSTARCANVKYLLKKKSCRWKFRQRRFDSPTASIKIKSSDSTKRWLISLPLSPPTVVMIVKSRDDSAISLRTFTFLNFFIRRLFDEKQHFKLIFFSFFFPPFKISLSAGIKSIKPSLNSVYLVKHANMKGNESARRSMR